MDSIWKWLRVYTVPVYLIFSIIVLHWLFGKFSHQMCVCLTELNTETGRIYGMGFWTDIFLVFTHSFNEGPLKKLATYK